MANRQLNAKLVMCNVPTTNSDAARKFYDALFGGEDFARSLNDKVESYFRPISQDGVTLTIARRQDDREPITCYFAVDDMADTVKQLEAVGGKVVLNSTPILATLLDPDGNYIGLMQLQGSLQRSFNARQAQRMLSQDQVNELDNWKQRGASLLK